MMGWGILTCPLPCCACKIDTEHNGNDASVECCRPSCLCLKSPLHYEMHTSSGGSSTTTKGCRCNIYCGSRPHGNGGYYYATNYTPGGLCLLGGINKFGTSLCDFFCCPVNVVYWCCK